MIEELVGLSYHTYTDSGFISLKKALDIDIIHKYGRVVSAVVIRPFFFQEGVGCLVYIIVFLKALLYGETKVKIDWGFSVLLLTQNSPDEAPACSLPL